MQKEDRANGSFHQNKSEKYLCFMKTIACSLVRARKLRSGIILSFLHERSDRNVIFPEYQSSPTEAVGSLKSLTPREVPPMLSGLKIKSKQGLCINAQMQNFPTLKEIAHFLRKVS
jgi:hypothetical protein